MTRSDPEPEPIAIRRTLYFSGLVQGVGFRYTAYHLAKKFDVVGYVKNLRDGRVETIVEGTPEEANQFIDAVKDAMNDYIENITSTDSPAQGEFTSFTIEF